MPKRPTTPTDLGTLVPRKPKGPQLYAKLEALLDELPIGALVPSERALAEQFGVARMTVRQQIEEFARAGKVTRVMGKGTFVARPRLPIVPVLPSFSQETAALGMTPGVAFAKVTTLPAREPLTSALQVKPRHPVMLLHRVRTADGVPLSVEYTYLSLERFPDLDQAPFEHVSLREYLREKYDCVVVRADRRFTVVALSAEDAEQLDVEVGTSAFLSEVTTYDDADRVVEVGTALILADRFEIRMSIDTRHGIITPTPTP